MHSTDTGSTAASLLVNNMRKRAREEILPIPQIYEQERRKMLTTDLCAPPGDIAQYLKLFNGVRSQMYRQRRYLIPQTPAAARDIRFEDEWCTTKLHQYGLEYITCERDLHSCLSACSHSVSGCWN